MPMWRTDGVILTILIHAGPVEFLYYWLHRALHHHYLYSRYLSHHHSSIVTEPITSVTHPFAELMSYYTLFAIPMLTMVFTGTGSVTAFAIYVTYIDFMNNMGHCNFEIIPKWLFSIFPPLKYLIYTPSFHSLHHTQFRTNYSLFMPFYDYIYGTMDKSTDQLYESALKRPEELPDVLHLTHLTTPESIYHLPFGFASLASKPYILRLQTWAIPKYNIQYSLECQKLSLNSLIEKAILEAEEKGIKVLSLGLMNQGKELNKYGGLYVDRNPKLRVKVVDGSSLAVAVVLNNIPKGTTQVLLRGKLTKVACATAFALSQKGIKVAVLHEDEYLKLNKSFNSNSDNHLVISNNYSQTTWLVGDGLSEQEQKKAPKGTLFIPYSQFPPKKYRKDCSYNLTPAMVTPLSLENVHSCENWLPRRIMSAWRIAGIVHALEGWNEHECGYGMLNIDKAWEASLRNGFQPAKLPKY
ncbi:Protein ECERIFERUM 1-like [Quillaja saponaria]|uniref:Protein ECERIFERUM 1-like n=1 Tax=Quillaja saponaria TaxID=32244 RepID=A0AAD7KWX3_QUISA|nr:Protein ECERIFERUM 1-like [Quillaja saponaria]